MNLPPETLQRLIDFAHAAMEKRSGIEDDATVSQSRRPDGYVTILAKDLRAIQKLGRPSWGPSIVDELKSKFGWIESDIEISGAAQFTHGDHYAAITEDIDGYNCCVYRTRDHEAIGWFNVHSAEQVHADFINGNWHTGANLMDYYLGNRIREATQSEVDASLEAEKNDGGHGVILVDGRKCYVIQA